MRCETGKVRFGGEREAHRKLRKAQKSFARGGRRFRQKVECRAYRCPICRGWHLTSHPLDY